VLIIGSVLFSFDEDAAPSTGINDKRNTNKVRYHDNNLTCYKHSLLSASLLWRVNLNNLNKMLLCKRTHWPITCNSANAWAVLHAMYYSSNMTSYCII
jgi:hypothetical protein